MRQLPPALRALICCLALLVAGGTQAHGHETTELTAHNILIFVHILLFVFWLGADLGTYVAGCFAVGNELGDADRFNAVWLMSAIDVVPRAAASLMLTVGGVLTEFVGLEHPPWQMAGILLLGPMWLALVLIGWFARGKPLGEAATQGDTWLRALLIPGILLSVSYSWFTGRLEPAPYVAGKLLLFATAMALSLVVRARLRPFRAALLAPSRDRLPEPAALSAGFDAARPYVFAVWACVALAAFLGIVQPGVPHSLPD